MNQKITKKKNKIYQIIMIVKILIIKYQNQIIKSLKIKKMIIKIIMKKLIHIKIMKKKIV